MTNIVSESGDMTTRNEEIAEILPTQLENASSTLNYNERFLKHKCVSEQNLLPMKEAVFDPNYPLHKLFTITELEHILANSHQICSGLDDIPLNFLQRLSEKLTYFSEFFSINLNHPLFYNNMDLRYNCSF